MKRTIDETREQYQDRMLGEFVTAAHSIAEAMNAQALSSMRIAEVAGIQLTLAEKRIAIQEQMAISSKVLEDKLAAELTTPKNRGPR